MHRQLIHKPYTVGVLGTIDPRTYRVADMPEGCVKAQQRPVVERRLQQVADLARGITLWDGTKINVVVANTVVGGPREAAAVQQQFEQAGVDAVVNSMTTWSMGWETDMCGRPDWLMCHEAMNGTAWPGAVLLNSKRAKATGDLAQVFSIYPPGVEGPDGPLPEFTVRHLTQFLLGASIVSTFRGSTYGSIGHVSMGIPGSEPNSTAMHKWWGMKLCHVDQIEALARIQKGMFDKAEAKRAAAWFFQTYEGRIDPASKRSASAVRDLVEKWLVPQTLVVRGILRGDDAVDDEERGQGLNALLGGTAGQRYWTDHYPNWDFTEATLSAGFDWNGVRAPITLATENDALNGIGMQIGTMLTGRPGLFADLRTYWDPDTVKALTGTDISNVAPTGFVHLINSGPAALEWGADLREADPEARMRAAIAAVTWHPAELGYFPNDGLSTHFCTPGGIPVTLLRINKVGNMITASIVEGVTIELPEEVASHVRARTNPTWPDTFVAPVRPSEFTLDQLVSRNDVFGLRDALQRACSAFDFMAKGNDPNHVVAIVGHHGAALRMLFNMWRIPVDFHNVPDSQVCLPTLYYRLGADEFRFSEKLGPRFLPIGA